MTTTATQTRTRTPAKSVPHLRSKQDSTTPGSWWKRAGDTVLIKCPNQHNGSMLLSAVDRAGVTKRAYRCSHKDCDFRERLRFEDWHGR